MFWDTVLNISLRVAFADLKTSSWLSSCCSDSSCFSRLRASSPPLRYYPSQFCSAVDQLAGSSCVQTLSQREICLLSAFLNFIPVTGLVLDGFPQSCKGAGIIAFTKSIGRWMVCPCDTVVQASKAI